MLMATEMRASVRVHLSSPFVHPRAWLWKQTHSGQRLWCHSLRALPRVTAVMISNIDMLDFSVTPCQSNDSLDMFLKHRFKGPFHCFYMSRSVYSSVLHIPWMQPVIMSSGLSWICLGTQRSNKNCLQETEDFNKELRCLPGLVLWVDPLLGLNLVYFYLLDFDNYSYLPHENLVNLFVWKSGKISKFWAQILTLLTSKVQTGTEDYNIVLSDDVQSSTL